MARMSANGLEVNRQMARASASEKPDVSDRAQSVRFIADNWRVCRQVKNLTLEIERKASGFFEC